jgi:hypothetical protein
MRANEFITERKKLKSGKIAKRHQQSTVGLDVFATSNFDRIYDLNRVMMAVAMTDGTNTPELNKESWAGKNNTAHPYTWVEQEMLEKAFKAAGIPHLDLNKGDMESKELDSTNKESPLKPFKGYKK